VESAAGGDPGEALADGVTAAMLVTAGLAAAAALVTRSVMGGGQPVGARR
jgi:hypothetical protein